MKDMVRSCGSIRAKQPEMKDRRRRCRQFIEAAVLLFAVDQKGDITSSQAPMSPAYEHEWISNEPLQFSVPVGT
jgi:hypothetical protein